jgi:hypothetical protein
MDNRILKINQINNKKCIIKRNYLMYENTFQYLQYRILRPLLKLKYKIFRLFNKPSPWLSPSAIIFLKYYLNKNQIGCEFGSGFSTLFFAPKIKTLVSIEHNESWYLMIKNKLNKSQITNVEYHLKPENDSIEFENVFFPFENEKLIVRRDFVNYFSALDNYENEYFDFILVDGRARCECALMSIDKLKKGGIMILDNSERVRYQFVFDLLQNWEMVNTTNGLTNTTFWVKPN